MIFTRIQFYFFLLALTISPFVLYNLIWLSSSKATVGKVIDLGRVRPGRYSSPQSFPVVEYQAGNETCTGFGNYNLPYRPGDDFPLRYSTRDKNSFRLNTFWGCWIATVIWSVIFFVLISIIFLVDGLVPKDKLVRLHYREISFIDRKG